MIHLDISVSPINKKGIEGVIHYFADVRYGKVHFTTSAVTDQSLISDVVDATVYDIQNGRTDFTRCPRCGGHLFHQRGSRGAGGCPCGQTVGYVGNGQVGEDRGYSYAGVFY